MIIVRSCKIALVAAIALFFTLVAYDNLTDYGSNWQFVQHVFAIETTFPDSDLHWRAIRQPAIQTAGYWLIIATQIAVTVLLWWGCGRLTAKLRSAGFANAKIWPGRD